MTGTELHNTAAASRDTENSADAVFQEEQNHLTSTYEAIEKIERNVLESMRKTAKEAEEDKRNMLMNLPQISQATARSRKPISNTQT